MRVGCLGSLAFWTLVVVVVTGEWYVGLLVLTAVCLSWMRSEEPLY